MTRYTVIWSQGTQDELAEMWLASSNRRPFTAAANRIDIELATKPQKKGLELGEGLRALFVPPLRVIFTVHEEDRVVEVLRVQEL